MAKIYVEKQTWVVRLGPRCWGRGAHRGSAMEPFEGAMVVSIVTIVLSLSNHLAALLQCNLPLNISNAQINMGGLLWAQFGEEWVDRCKPNFNAFWEPCRMPKIGLSYRYLLPFEHNARTSQTDRPQNGNVDRNRRNLLSAMMMMMK